MWGHCPEPKHSSYSTSTDSLSKMWFHVIASLTPALSPVWYETSLLTFFSASKKISQSATELSFRNSVSLFTRWLWIKIWGLGFLQDRVAAFFLYLSFPRSEFTKSRTDLGSTRTPNSARWALASEFISRLDLEC